MKYTVTVNHTEYAEGLFDTLGEAQSYAANKIRQDIPDILEDVSDEDILDDYDADGYYRVVDIREVSK